MDYPPIIAILCIIVNSWNWIISVMFLSFALVNYRRCANFSTILACNTALATLIYSSVNITSGSYMFIWDHQIIPIVDPLCSIRAYFYHSSIAAIHHSFVLQVIYKFYQIKGLAFLKTRVRKCCFILIQWAFDFIYHLPPFLLGHMIKLSSDNLCFVDLSKIQYFVYMAALSYFIPDIMVNVIHKLLVRYVRKVSSQLNINRERQIRRDLVVVRRIVILNAPLALVGIPALTVIILTSIRSSLLPRNSVRAALVLTNLPFSIILSILFWLTPDLRACLNILHNRFRVMRVYPMVQMHSRVKPLSTRPQT